MIGNPNEAATDANFFGEIKGIYFPLARAPTRFSRGKYPILGAAIHRERF
jgi:hypothetical protein